MLSIHALRRFFEAHPPPGAASVPGFSLAGQSLRFDGRPYLTGVINMSADSWYDTSIATGHEAAIARGLALAKAGARFIDIGAESTLPEAERVGPDAQLDRLLPVVRALSDAGLIVSVESYRPEVLDAAGQAGAKIFNLTGRAATETVFELAVRHEAAVILCYVEGENVREVGDLPGLDDMTPRLLRYFEAETAKARALGLHRCFLDPGLGFYYRNLEDGQRRVEYQIQTYLEASRLWKLGFPVFNILPHASAIFQGDSRPEAEPFFAVLAALLGSHVLRTHEVERVSRVLSVMECYPDAR